MSEPTDIVAALVALLEADAGVTAIAGSRIFGLELPKAEAGQMPRAAVVLQASGGASLTAGSYAPHDSQRIDAVCWGATPLAAAALRAAVGKAFRAVKRQVFADTLIHWISPAGGYASLRDPDTDWPAAFQSFQVFHALEAATA